MMPANSALVTSQAPTGVAVTRVPGAGGRRSWLEWILSTVADRGRAFAPVPAAGVSPLERARLLASSLLSGRGEASGAAIARELHVVLKELGPADRVELYRFLATNFQPGAEKLRGAAEAYLAALLH